MTAATFGRSNSPVDSSKLVHHVKKLLQTTTTANHNHNLAAAGAQRTTKTTAEEMVRLLRTHHREYLRKDVVRLRIQVEQVLQQQQQQQQQLTPSKMPAKRKRSQKEKRKESADQLSTSAAACDNTASEEVDEAMNRNKDPDNDDNEMEYDTAAKEHDWLRESIQHAGGGLNATLCQRYKKVAQAQAEAAAAAAASAALEEEQAEAVSTSTPPEGEGGLAPNASQAVTDDTSSTPNTPSGTTTAAAAAPLRGEDGTTATATTKKRKTGTKSNSNKRRIRSGPFARTANGTNHSAGPFDDAAFSPPPDFMSPVPRPKERYSDLGGMDAVITQIRQLVEYPLLRPELYRHLGVEPPRGVLLRGPPGVGKTHLSHAVAGQLGDVVAYFCVSAPELVSGMSGESEGRIRNLFQAASDHAPAIIFLDELDAIAPKRGNDGGSGSSRGMEKRMVAQLLTCMDMIAPPNNRNQNAVIVLAATNRPDALDAALRRAGRFDKEILLGVPDEDAREHILRAMTKDMRLDGDFDYKALARRTPGYVGADVRSLAKEAAVLAINRIFRNVLENGDAVRNTTTTEQDDGEASGCDGANSSASAVSAISKEEDTSSSVPAPTKALATNAMPLPALTPEQMEPLYITMDDFLNALPLVQPSSKREGFATVPDVCWDNIGALESIREELTISVLEPIKFPEKFKALGLSLPAGVLLYGPPGCGKTLIAKAIARESGANFISVKGPELLDKYVGESERAVRLVFERARCSSPCVVFFDELDSLVPRRGSDGGGSSGVSERVVNQLLTELDGLESRRSVFVIAATNRPELIDPAMLRPGRLDKLLYVPLPTPEDRVSILKALAVNIVLHSDVDLDAIGRSLRATGYSGADCAALLREAGLAVLKEDNANMALQDAPTSTDNPPTLSIESRHFDKAFENVLPSVSRKDQARYDRIRERMARARTRTPANEEETVVEPSHGENGSNDLSTMPPSSGL